MRPCDDILVGWPLVVPEYHTIFTEEGNRLSHDHFLKSPLQETGSKAVTNFFKVNIGEKKILKMSKKKPHT